MKLYRPTKTNLRTQGFGENRAWAKIGVRPFQVVAKNTVCPSGYRSFYEELGMEGHNGEDWATWDGEPLYFPVRIPNMEWWARSCLDTDGGIGVDVFSSKPVELGLPPQTGQLAKQQWGEQGGKLYVKFRFHHLREVSVPTGNIDLQTGEVKNPIKFGQFLGNCDSTGASSGNHLHWSMKFVAKNSLTLDNDNGYYGAVDFSAWFENEFVLDVLHAGDSGSALDI